MSQTDHQGQYISKPIVYEMAFEICQEEVTRLQWWCAAPLEKLSNVSQKKAGYETPGRS